MFRWFINTDPGQLEIQFTGSLVAFPPCGLGEPSSAWARAWAFSLSPGSFLNTESSWTLFSKSDIVQLQWVVSACFPVKKAGFSKRQNRNLIIIPASATWTSEGIYPRRFWQLSEILAPENQSLLCLGRHIERFCCAFKSGGVESVFLWVDNS